MTVYQDGYTCPVCGPVKAKLWWSKKEDDLVASCAKCGMKIQRVIPAQPFSTPMFAQKLGQSGELGLGTKRRVSSVNPFPAPVPPEEDSV